MLDEAHERTLYTDIALGLLKKVKQSFWRNFTSLICFYRNVSFVFL